MQLKYRTTVVALLASVSLMGATAPALATGNGKWSKARCESYKKEFERTYPHLTKVEKSIADHQLKIKKCGLTVVK